MTIPRESTDMFLKCLQAYMSPRILIHSSGFFLSFLININMTHFFLLLFVCVYNLTHSLFSLSLNDSNKQYGNKRRKKRKIH